MAPSQSVLDAAKKKTLNSFVFNFSSSDAQLQRLLSYTLVGLPQVGAISCTHRSYQSLLSISHSLNKLHGNHFKGDNVVKEWDGHAMHACLELPPIQIYDMRDSIISSTKV